MRNGYRIILGSASPRRKKFFEQMGIECEIRPSNANENYSDKLERSEISDFLAKLKADFLKETLKPDEILITSDTVVWHRGESLAKPNDRDEAYKMLRKLSDDTHEVITSVCFTTIATQKVVNQITSVEFNKLSDEEIYHYIDTYKPYDKAGGYGIQEWIGIIGIKKIVGSYETVVGLPTALVYNTLKEMTSKAFELS